MGLRGLSCYIDNNLLRRKEKSRINKVVTFSEFAYKSKLEFVMLVFGVELTRTH